MSYNEQLQQARFGLSQTNNHAVAPLPSPSIVTGARMGNHFSIYFLIIFSISPFLPTPTPPHRVRPESNLIYWPLQKTQFCAHAQTFRCIFLADALVFSFLRVRHRCGAVYSASRRRRWWGNRSQADNRPVTKQSFFFFFAALVSRKFKCSATCSAKHGGCAYHQPHKESMWKHSPQKKQLCELHQVFFLSLLFPFLLFFFFSARPRPSLALQCAHASHFARIQSTAANSIQKSTFSPLPQSQ